MSCFLVLDVAKEKENGREREREWTSGRAGECVIVKIICTNIGTASIFWACFNLLSFVSRYKTLKNDFKACRKVIYYLLIFSIMAHKIVYNCTLQWMSDEWERIYQNLVTRLNCNQILKSVRPFSIIISKCENTSKIIFWRQQRGFHWFTACDSGTVDPLSLLLCSHHKLTRMCPNQFSFQQIF